MSKLLLLVQSQDDVTHLDAAARAILNSAITGVWVVFSPAITVNASEAAAKLDTEIAQLRAAESAAAQRTDYEAAKDYKANREAKELDRAKALRDAWKTAPEEDRKMKVKDIFGPFMSHLQKHRAGINIRVTGHSDHYDREQWVQMLNSLTGVWFKPFTPGSFVVAWPESVETSIKTADIPLQPAITIQPTAEDLQKSREQRAAQSDHKNNRREELEGMHHMSIRPIAKKYGIEATGKTEMIGAILAHEAKAASAPAAVEEY